MNIDPLIPPGNEDDNQNELSKLEKVIFTEHQLKVYAMVISGTIGNFEKLRKELKEPDPQFVKFMADSLEETVTQTIKNNLPPEVQFTAIKNLYLLWQLREKMIAVIKKTTEASGCPGNGFSELDAKKREMN